MNPDNNKNIRAIWPDVLRIIFCTFVCIDHISHTYSSTEAAVAVAGFFLLSGYLMGRSFERMHGNFSVIHFYSGKVRRLLPLFVISIVIGAISAYGHHLHEGKAFIPAIESCSIPFFDIVSHFNNPLWFMLCVISFIALAPIFFYLYQSGAKVLMVTTSVLLLYAAWLLSTSDEFYWGIQVHFWQFVAGLLMYKIYKEGTGKCTPSLKISLCCVLIVLGIVLSFILPSGRIYFTISWTLIFAGLIPISFSLPNPFGAKSTALIGYLAILTYPIYLFHLPIRALIYGVGTVALHLEPLFLYCLIVPAILIFSAMMQRVCDALFVKNASR